MRVLLLKVSISRLAYIEVKYSVPSLHVGFAKKKQTAQMSGLVTGEDLRRLMDGGSIEWY